MRKVVLFLVCVVVLTETGWGQKNLLKNPGFDALYDSIGGGMHPIYWTRRYGYDSMVKTTTSEIKQGYRALWLDDTGSSQVGVISDMVDVAAGFNYTASVDVKCVNTPNKACLYLRFYDASDTLLLSKNVWTLSSSWTTLTITEMAPENAVGAEVLCYIISGSDTGQVYFDNASLVLADEMLANGSWDACQTGTLPPNWLQKVASNPASIEVYDSQNVMCIDDQSSTYAQGAYILLPADPCVPYKLTADGRKISSSDDGATLWLRFLDASLNIIEDTHVQVASTTWSNYQVVDIAPANAAYIHVMFYSATMHTGTTLFADVHLTEDYELFYASPSGTGDGSSYSTPASYSSSSLWSAVDTQAATWPVKVILKSGTYGASNMLLESIGDATNPIVIEGEDPFGAVFDSAYGVRFYGTRNTILRGVHFEGTTQQNTPIMVGQANSTTQDIVIDGCSFINLTSVIYAAITVSQPSTHDISVQDCIFVRVGTNNDGSHMIYNSKDAYNIDIIDNYFEDGWGTYLKIRSGSSNYCIKDNVFIQNNGYRTSSSKPFIHFSAINTGTTDEVLGSNYTIQDNIFEYNLYSAYPLWIWVVGDTPVNHPGYHQVTLSEKNVIEGTGYSDATRNAEIEDNFGVDILNDWAISGNTYYNASATRLRFSTDDPPSGYYEVFADITALIQ